MSDSFFNSSPSYSLRQVLSLNLEWSSLIGRLHLPNSATLGENLHLWLADSTDVSSTDMRLPIIAHPAIVFASVPYYSSLQEKSGHRQIPAPPVSLIRQGRTGHTCCLDLLAVTLHSS